MTIEIKGFGKGKCTLVHAIRKNGKLLCNTRREMPAEDFKPKDVTCKVCLTFVDLRNLIEKGKTPIKEEKQEDIKTMKKKENPKPKEKEKKENNIEKTPPEDFTHEIKGDSVNIVHTPTGTKMFQKVPIEIINVAIAYLNTIPSRWTGGEVPKSFIPECREAYKTAFEEMQIKPPLNLCGEIIEEKISPKNPKKKSSKKKGEPKRTLKRRPKVEKEKPKKLRRRRGNTQNRVLRRRSESKLFGIFIKGRIPHTVASMIKNGSYELNIINKISKEYSLTTKKAKRRVITTIKKMIEKAGLCIQCTMEQDKSDYYEIVEK